MINKIEIKTADGRCDAWIAKPEGKGPWPAELYVGAHHHFTMADLPAYDEAAAEKHWTKLLSLMTKLSY